METTAWRDVLLRPVLADEWRCGSADRAVSVAVDAAIGQLPLSQWRGIESDPSLLVHGSSWHRLKSLTVHLLQHILKSAALIYCKYVTYVSFVHH